MVIGIYKLLFTLYSLTIRVRCQCDAGWLTYQNHCILGVVDGRNWLDARSHCQSENADLIILYDANINNFVKDSFSSGAWWINLNDMSEESKFVWRVNEKEVKATFTYWDPSTNEPNDLKGEDCTEIDIGFRNGLWNDLSCAKTRPFICSKCQKDIMGIRCQQDCKTIETDILFLVDASRSQDSYFSKSISFMERFVNNANVNPGNCQIALSVYSHETQLLFDFDKYTSKAGLLTRLQTLKSSVQRKGPTLTTRAILHAKEIIASKSTGSRGTSTSKYIFLLTDGLSSETADVSSIIHNVHKGGIRIFAIGVGGQMSHKYLYSIGNEDNSVNVFSHYDDEAIKRLRLYELEKEKCPLCSQNSMVDLLVLVDTSAYIVPHQLSNTVNVTLPKMVNLLHQTNSNIHLGLVRYGADVETVSDFVDMSFADDINLQAARFYNDGGNGNVSDALEISEQLFENEGRKGAKKTIVLLSNGKWERKDTDKLTTNRLFMKNITIYAVATEYFDVASEEFHIDIDNILSVLNDPFDLFYSEINDDKALRSLTSIITSNSCE